MFIKITGWARLSELETLYLNFFVSLCFSFLSFPIQLRKFSFLIDLRWMPHYLTFFARLGVATVVKRKILPYSILQIASGVSIFILLAFNDKLQNGSVIGRVFVGHIANVLISSVNGLLYTLNVESFPERYR